MNGFNLLRVFSSRLRSMYMDRRTGLFIKHNNRVWNQAGHHAQHGEILLELNTIQSAIISYSYLANVLQQKHHAKIVAYDNRYTPHGNAMLNKLVHLLRAVASRAAIKTYTSFGAASFIAVNPDRQQRARAARLFEEVYPSLNNKRDVENLVVDGVWIGDLIYDSYLRKYSEPTIGLRDEKFIQFMRESLEAFVFWQDYFRKHDIRAVNVSHCVYNNAMPLRIAVKNNVEAYQSNATHVYRLSKDNMFAYGDYKYFPGIFSKLSARQQRDGLQEARKRIDLRFSGKVGVDMAYSTKSAYGGKKSQPVLRPSGKKKILVAAHCFFDSPHSYGNNLFPDFYEWFDFLGKISNETDYDWYIKTHPDFLPGNLDIINYFVNKYPEFTLIDASTSHHQLIDEGISCALTTYGTIGFEYAALGIPVVNASVNNPHIAYNFNLHPKSVDEYRDILKNLDHIDLRINKNEVYEYYFMKHIYNTNDWLFDDYRQMEEYLGGYSDQFTSKVYEYWMREWTQEKHRNVCETLERFIDSGEFRLNHSYMNSSGCIDAK